VSIRGASRLKSVAASEPGLAFVHDLTKGRRMDKESLLYTLSTLAQTSAALLAFIGALALYRLSQLREGCEEAVRSLRGLFVDLGKVPEVIAIWPRDKILEDARAIIDGTYVHDSIGEIRIKGRREGFLGELHSRLTLFALCHLAVIFVSLGGFLGARFLDGSWIAAGVFAATSAVAVAVTGAMLRKIWEPPSKKAFRAEVASK
jgi:hypothetical protein